MAHRAAAGGAAAEDHEEIPDFTAPRPRPAERERGGFEDRRPGKGRPERGERGGRDGFSERPGKRGAHRDAGGAPTTKLFIGAGRERGIRPQDLVGAIANEAGLSGRQIGSIEISDRFSLVEVPEAAADHVVAALSKRTIKGRKTTVRREGARTRRW